MESTSAAQHSIQSLGSGLVRFGSRATRLRSCSSEKKQAHGVEGFLNTVGPRLGEEDLLARLVSLPFCPC